MSSALHWSKRILEYPVRTAAVDTFLQELKAKRAGDLNGVLVTLNDGSLCRAALSYWVGQQWIVVAPHSPLLALPGALFTRDLTLAEFCGAEAGESEQSGSEEAGSEEAGSEEAGSEEAGSEEGDSGDGEPAATPADGGEETKKDEGPNDEHDS